MELVQAVMPEVPLAEQRQQVLEVLSAMAATGLTGGHVMDGMPESLELLRQVESDGDLPMRLRLAPMCMPGTDPARAHRAAAAWPAAAGGSAR